MGNTNSGKKSRASSPTKSRGGSNDNAKLSDAEKRSDSPSAKRPKLGTATLPAGYHKGHFALKEARMKASEVTEAGFGDLGFLPPEMTTRITDYLTPSGLLQLSASCRYGQIFVNSLSVWDKLNNKVPIEPSGSPSTAMPNCCPKGNILKMMLMRNGKVLQDQISALDSQINSEYTVAAQAQQDFETERIQRKQDTEARFSSQLRHLSRLARVIGYGLLAAIAIPTVWDLFGAFSAIGLYIVAVLLIGVVLVPVLTMRTLPLRSSNNADARRFLVLVFNGFLALLFFVFLPLAPFYLLDITLYARFDKYMKERFELQHRHEKQRAMDAIDKDIDDKKRLAKDQSDKRRQDVLDRRAALQQKLDAMPKASSACCVC